MPTDQSLTPESKMDLPPPVAMPEAVNAPDMKNVKRQGTEVNPEFLPPSGQSPQVGNPTQPPTAGSPPAALPGAHGSAIAATSTVAGSNPPLAEDVDLIEKEWVEKAKAIVNHTKNDPHRQSKEINKMKADYIKKRYNKDVQVSD